MRPIEIRTLGLSVSLTFGLSYLWTDALLRIEADQSNQAVAGPGLMILLAVCPLAFLSFALSLYLRTRGRFAMAAVQTLGTGYGALVLYWTGPPGFVSLALASVCGVLATSLMGVALALQRGPKPPLN